MLRKATGKFNRLAALLAIAGACVTLSNPASAGRPDDEPPPTGGALFGTIDFEDIAPNALIQEVTFELRANDNSIVSKRTLWVAPDGRFTLTGLPLGEYYLRVKADRYLATTHWIANSSEGAIFFLRAGDAKNDNLVDLDDLHLIVRAYRAVRGKDARYNPSADLNGDGIVNAVDLELLVRNFGSEGDW